MYRRSAFPKAAIKRVRERQQEPEQGGLGAPPGPFWSCATPMAQPLVLGQLIPMDPSAVAQGQLESPHQDLVLQLRLCPKHPRGAG